MSHPSISSQYYSVIAALLIISFIISGCNSTAIFYAPTLTVTQPATQPPSSTLTPYPSQTPQPTNTPMPTYTPIVPPGTGFCL